MKFIMASAVWLIVGSVLGYGMLKFAHGGSFWAVLIPVLAFLVIVGKVGYKTH
jgi:hypothetical protein